MHTTALLLAAGRSSRSGQINKLLYTWNGKPVLSYAVDAIRNSRVQSCLAVTGHMRQEVESVLCSSNVQSVHNSLFADGMASSLACGVAALADTDAVLVCLGDMPHINSDIINKVLKKAEQHPQKSLIVPVYTGRSANGGAKKRRRGHPVLFRKEMFDQLRQLSGDRGAKELFSQYPEQVLELPMTTQAIIMDYDTPTELSFLPQNEAP